jgi:hypothetical protein
VAYSIIFFDGDRQIGAVDWTMDLEAAIHVTTDFVGVCGGTHGCIRDASGAEVWAVSPSTTSLRRG